MVGVPVVDAASCMQPPSLLPADFFEGFSILLEMRASKLFDLQTTAEGTKKYGFPTMNGVKYGLDLSGIESSLSPDRSRTKLAHVSVVYLGLYSTAATAQSFMISFHRKLKRVAASFLGYIRLKLGLPPKLQKGGQTACPYRL